MARRAVSDDDRIEDLEGQIRALKVPPSTAIVARGHRRRRLVQRADQLDAPAEPGPALR